MKKLIITLIIFLLLPILLFSQSIVVTRDMGVWTGITISTDISKNIELDLEQQLRFYQNARTLDDYLIDLGARYKINKNFKLGMNIRYVYNDKRWSATEHNLRYNFDLLYRAKLIKKLKLYYRFRHQRNNVINWNPYASAVKMIAFRHRLKLKYKIFDKVNIYGSTEFFQIIENLSLPYWGKYRINAGSVIQTKIGDFDLSLGYEQEMNCNKPLSFYYLKTIYTISL